jgi:hypothetical protein
MEGLLVLLSQDCQTWSPIVLEALPKNPSREEALVKEASSLGSVGKSVFSNLFQPAALPDMMQP